MPVEDLVADRLAADGVAVRLRHRQRRRVELGGDVQLVQRALPLAEHAQQLEQEDAQLGVGRLGADLLLQLRERGRGIAVLQAAFGGVGKSHDACQSSAVLAPLILEHHPPCGWPSPPCGVYSTAILLNEKLTRSTSAGLPLSSPASTSSDSDAAVLDRDLQVFELRLAGLAQRQHRLP